MLSLLNIFLGLANWVDGIFDPIFENMLSDVTDTSRYGSALNILDVHSIAAGFNIAQDAVTGVGAATQGVTTSIGIALTVTYFIISLMSLASRDNTTLEHYIKEFIKLVIAVTVVAESWPIMLNLLQIGNAAVSATNSLSASGDTNTIQDLVLGMKEGSEYSGIAGVAMILLPTIIAKIAVLACYVAVFMRAVDLAWRAALFPIGVANLFDGGPNSPGLKYAKSFLGAVLAGCVIVLCVKIMPSLLQVGFEGGAKYTPSVESYLNDGGTDLGNYKDNVKAATAQYIQNGRSGGGRGNDPGGDSEKSRRKYVQSSITWGLITMVAVEIGVVGAMFGASSKIKEVFS